MSLPHYSEVFVEDASPVIGWQCLLCGEEAGGFKSINEAEAAAAFHDQAANGTKGSE